MILSIAGLHTSYGPVKALRGIDLEVDEGEIVTLIGANGAGKSTLLMSICGTPRASAGQVLFDGEDITALPTFRIVRRGIAQAPEGRRIFPRMTVFENLQMGAVTADESHFDTDLERVFAVFPILAERRDQRGGTLSGGEQQMLAIARALMSRPRLLLLDEPSLGLAPLFVKQIFEVIGEPIVRVGIFDLAGSRVRRIHDGPNGIGRYERRFDGRDDEGALLPPGIYLARVELSTDASGSTESIEVIYLAY